MSRHARTAFSRSAAVFSGPSCSAADRDAPTSTEPSAFWWMPSAWAASAPWTGELAGREPLERDRVPRGRVAARLVGGLVDRVAQDRRARGVSSASQPRTGRTGTSTPSACASRRVHAPAATSTAPAASGPASVTTAPAPIRFDLDMGADVGSRRGGRGGGAGRQRSRDRCGGPRRSEGRPAIPAARAGSAAATPSASSSSSGDRRVLRAPRAGASCRRQQQRPDRRAVEAEARRRARRPGACRRRCSPATAGRARRGRAGARAPGCDRSPRTRARRARAASRRRRPARGATRPSFRPRRRRSRSRPARGWQPTVPPAFAPITSHMEFVLPLAGAGFALGWPIEWLIQRFPKGEGTAPSSRRRWIVAAVTAALFAAVTMQDRLHSAARAGAAPDGADRARLGHRPAPPHHPERDQLARRGRRVPDRRHRPARPLGGAPDRRRGRRALPRRRLADLPGRDGARRREDDADDRSGARDATRALRCSPRLRSRCCRRSPCWCSRARAAARSRSRSARSSPSGRWSRSCTGRSSGTPGTWAHDPRPPHRSRALPGLPRVGRRLLADDGVRRSGARARASAPPGCRST